MSNEDIASSKTPQHQILFMKKIINTLFLVLLFVNTSVFAATRTVCVGSGTYGTIAAAIAAAGNGDEIVICPGNYNESLSFSQSNLTFRSSTGNRSDVKINNSRTVFTISGNSASFKNLSITSTGDEAIVGAYAGRGAHTFQNLAVSGANTAIHLNNGGPHTFKLSSITSSNGGGIAIDYVEDAGIANVFEDLTINVKNTGIVVNRGAAQTMRNLVINSSAGGGINLGFNSDGPHVFENINVTSSDDGIVAVRGAGAMKSINLTSSNGAGISLGNKYAGVFQDMIIKAKNEGFVINNQDSVSSPFSFSNIRIASSASQAIRVVRAGALTFSGITIDDAGGNAGDGLAVEAADSVNVNNICVKSADRYGIRFDYNARNTSIRNAIIKGNGNYGVYIYSDPSAVSHVNNSCFYKAPCAAAGWPTSARDFSGNYMEPGRAACNNNEYVAMTAPLNNCPVVDSSCVSGVPIANASGGFNAYESVTAAGAINGVIKTKIAGIPITLDVIALNAANTAIASGFTGDVKVEVIANINLDVPLNAANCPTTSTLLTSQTLTFAAANAGRKSIAIAAVPNVFRDARLRFTYPATGTASTVVCSTDNFAIRPSRFAAVSARDADWQTAGTTRTLNNNASADGNVHKAGQPFTLQATAVNAATTAATTTNYAGSPTAVIACTLPTPGCVNGTLDAGAWSGSGTVTSSTALYAEAGSFNLTLSDQTFANVDIKAGDSSATEYTISSAPVPVGRFVPNHFTLTPQGAAPVFRTFNAECSARSFTYIGQPFRYATVPVVLITAKNAAQGTTYNYRGDLWNLGGENVAQEYDSNNVPRDGDLKNTPLVAADSAMPGTGSITVSSTDQLKFLRNMTTPQAPFNANISLSVTVREVVPGHGDIQSKDPAIFNGNGSGIAFDQGAAFRYGRMRIENASGSELLDMSIPLKTDYWNGSTFVLNAADNCTVISAANVNLGPYGGGITAANMPVSRIASGNTILQGVGSIILREPLPAPTAKGSVDVCIDLAADTAPAICTAASSALQPWLQGKWSQINYDDDPSGRATFGIHRSGPIIYMREIY